ncbi:hypothetical protein GCM10023205_78840 [Yinghuangia aomiensis]|uniref:Uncharacterized protein n=1 Tax=Yinghuangia aomiensis TaxID=676205 RepID=A0ABP9ID60_9ACTN
MNPVPDAAGEGAIILPLAVVPPLNNEPGCGLKLLLNDRTTVVWTLEIPDGPFGAVRDAALGVTLIYESVRTVGGWQRQFSAWRDSQLPDVLRVWIRHSKHTFRIASDLDEIVRGLTKFDPRDAT